MEQDKFTKNRMLQIESEQLQEQLLESNSKEWYDEAFEKAIEKAKSIIMKRRKGEEGRNWLIGIPRCTDCSLMYEVRLYVLEGSPPRGYILADRISGIVKCWDIYMTRPYTIRK